MNNIDLDYGLGQRCEGSYFGEGKHKQTFYDKAKELAEEYDLDFNDPSTRLYSITKKDEIERKLNRENNILNWLMPERRNRRKTRIIEEGLADVKKKAKEEVERMDDEDWFRLKQIPLVKKFEDIDEEELDELIRLYRGVDKNKNIGDISDSIIDDNRILQLEIPDENHLRFGQKKSPIESAKFDRHKTAYLGVKTGPNSGHLSTLIKRQIITPKSEDGFTYTTNPLFATTNKSEIEHWDPHRLSYEDERSAFFPYKEQLEDREIQPTALRKPNECVQGPFGACLPWSYLRSRFPEKSPDEFSELVNAKLDPVRYPKFYDAIYKRAIQDRLDRLYYPVEDPGQRQKDEQRIIREMIEDPDIRTGMIWDTFNELKDVIPLSILHRNQDKPIEVTDAEMDALLESEGYAISFMTPEKKIKTYRELGLGKRR